jgi:AraC-like DNA-binding protein
MWQYPGLIASFGIVFSLFLSSILIAKPCPSMANWYLAGFVLSNGISICYETLFPTGLYRVLPQLIKIYIPTQFLIGPWLFLYVSAITEPRFRFTKATFIHFLPFLLTILYLAPFFLEPAAAKIAFVEATVSSAIPSRPEEWLIWIGVQASLWTYTILSLRKCMRYRRLVRENVSNISRYALNWLFVFLIFVLIILISFLAIDALMLSGIPLVAFNPFISISMTVSIVYLGWRGLLRFEYIFPAGDERNQTPPVQERKADEYAALFAEIMEAVRRDKLFRSPELTLPELAMTLGVSRTELSRIINLGGDMNFYDFINKLRVEDVQRRLESADDKCLSILQAALDSGFNTKSTFQASFKKWTGLTPSLYRKQAVNKELSLPRT